MLFGFWDKGEIESENVKLKNGGRGVFSYIYQNGSDYIIRSSFHIILDFKIRRVIWENLQGV